MKKIILILLLLLMLVGCKKSSNTDGTVEESAHTFHETILKLDHTTLSDHSSYYDIEWTASRNNSGSYRYTVTISNPKMAMCSIKAMAVEDGLYGDSSNTSKMPQIGMNGETVNLYPNQVNEDEGCYEKIELVLNSDYEEVWVSVVVDWKNKEGSKGFREYLSKLVTYKEGE